MGSRVDPDFVEEEANSVAKVFADALAIANRNTYNEGNWQKWMLGICACLVVIGVGGTVAMYGKMTAFEVKLEDVKEQVTRLTFVVENHKQ